MLNKPLLTAAIAAVALFGCGSFNNYQYPPAVLMVVPSASANGAAVLTACVYQPPQAEPMPDVPLKELEKISPYDDDALDEIQQKHIAELRNYIIRDRRTQDTAYKDYLKRCGIASGKNTG